MAKRGYYATNMYKRDGNGSLVHSKKMQGRNEMCHCNSGRKFKNCHGQITLIALRKGPLKGYGFFVSVLFMFFIVLAFIYFFLVQ